MGKQIIYTCDVCGQQIQDNPQPNFSVMLNSSDNHLGPQAFDAYVCDDCVANSSVENILAAIADAAKKATNLIAVASITLKAVNVDDTIQGIPVNSQPIISKPGGVQPTPVQKLG